MRYSGALLSTLALAACNFTPTAGAWSMFDFEVVESTCPATDDGGDTDAAAEGVPAELALTTDENFTWTMEDLDPQPFGCTLSGKDFDCGVHRTETEPLGDDSAVVTYSTSLVGEFRDEARLSGTIVFTIECLGDACETYIADNDLTIPCSTETSFGAQLGG